MKDFRKTECKPDFGEQSKRHAFPGELLGLFCTISLVVACFLNDGDESGANFSSRDSAAAAVIVTICTFYECWRQIRYRCQFKDASNRRGESSEPHFTV